MHYFPEFKGAIEGYVVNFAAKNVWRVERLYNIDDLKQEGYEVFLRCATRYTEIETPQHFMALFKTSWERHFIDLARDDTASRIMVQHSVIDGHESTPAETIGESDHDGYLSILLKEAPREISMVLNLFLNAPQEILDIALSGWQGRDKRFRTGGSLRICQMLGIDASKDILQDVEDYLTNT